jgi:integrase
MIRLHDTRHGACSMLLAGGVPIEVVQVILGHASPEITRKVYGHPDEIQSCGPRRGGFEASHEISP